MTREEEIVQAADECYPTWEEHNDGFCQGAKWADKNPRKGLWDSEKVSNFLNNNANKYIEIVEGKLKLKKTLITDLCKAMED